MGPFIWGKVIVNIDEGSELNCIDADLFYRTDLQIIPSSAGARSAGSFEMKIEGQMKTAVCLDIIAPASEATISLGHCLVVKNLGVEMLLGQPAKFHHNIVTLPNSSLMTFKDILGKNHSCSTLDDNTLRNETTPKKVLRLDEDAHIYPGEKLVQKLTSEFSPFS